MPKSKSLTNRNFHKPKLNGVKSVPAQRNTGQIFLRLIASSHTRSLNSCAEAEGNQLTFPSWLPINCLKHPTQALRLRMPRWNQSRRHKATSSHFVTASQLFKQSQHSKATDAQLKSIDYRSTPRVVIDLATSTPRSSRFIRGSLKLAFNKTAGFRIHWIFIDGKSINRAATFLARQKSSIFHNFQNIDTPLLRYAITLKGHFDPNNLRKMFRIASTGTEHWHSFKRDGKEPLTLS